MKLQAPNRSIGRRTRLAGTLQARLDEKPVGVSALGTHAKGITVAFESTTVTLGGNVRYSESRPRRKHEGFIP